MLIWQQEKLSQAMGASHLLETLKGVLFAAILYSISRLLSFFADTMTPEEHGISYEGREGPFVKQNRKEEASIEDPCHHQQLSNGAAERRSFTGHAAERAVADYAEEIPRGRVVDAEDGEEIFFDAGDGELLTHESLFCTEKVGAEQNFADEKLADGGALREERASLEKLSFAEDDAAENEDPRKQEFLALYKEQYGYLNSGVSINKLRSDEFPHLKGDIYLDHAGATLYSKSQICSSLEDLCSKLYGNPHSQSGCSNISSTMIANAREEVLKFFNVTRRDYKCVFTAGATAALKLVGECFPWTTKSKFCYTMENHNSVLGIREYALAAGASAYALEIEGCGQQLSFKFRERQARMISSAHNLEEGLTFNLFAFPSECNFSGKKVDLDIVKFVQDGACTKDSENRFMVLIDAAKGCGTSRLDLSKYPADFVAISFYKIFGYPTGLGALLLRDESSRVLEKRYFGGGAVAASAADVDFFQKRKSIEQSLEDGTVPFLQIAALHGGFSIINRLGISNIGRHVGSLAKFTAAQLSGFKHKNGNNVCVLYGTHGSVHYWGDNCSQGPIVTFNLKRSDGTWVGHREVEKLASLNGIHLRTGCFCNPGACSKHLELSEADIRANHEAGHVCWDDHDIIDGKPTGAVRVSFGYMSTIEDALALLDFICNYFMEKENFCNELSLIQPTLRELVSLPLNDFPKPDYSMSLESITIYPIKSCGGFTVDSWRLGNCGLVYDREWLVMSSAGFALTQKKCPMMCLIGTYIERSTNTLLITSPNMKTKLEIPIVSAPHHEEVVRFELCGEGFTGRSYEKEVADWFTEALGTACTLVKKQPRSRHLRLRGGTCESQACKDAKELSYANEGQFLLVSRASVEDLNRRAVSSLLRIQSKQKKKAHLPSMQVDAMRFRPNFVVSGGSAFEEDSWQSLNIGGHKFIVVGGCNRCQMVNIDQSTGRWQEGNNPLLTLATYRRSKGQILFGLLLAHDPAQQHELEQMGRQSQPERTIIIGSRVHAERNPTA